MSVTILVNLLNNLQHLALDVSHQDLLPLRGCHSTHYLAEDAYEHVHDREGGQQDVEEEEPGEDGALLAKFVCEVLDVVTQRAIDAQRVHGIEHRQEVPSAHLCSLGHLAEGNTKGIHDEDQQGQGYRHGAHGRDHALDHDHELRHGPQEPRHARHPREAHEPRDLEHGAVAQAAPAPRAAGDEQVERHDPRLEHHHEDHDGVKDKPRIFEGVLLFLEGCEADNPLEGERRAEEVLCDLEHRVGHDEHLGIIVVGVDSYPDCVQGNDSEHRPLKDDVFGDERSDAGVLEMVARVSLVICKVRSHLLFHRLCVYEDGGLPLPR
mmetsp:Transcript_116180/g.339806  ORF Transcript_116180/g.339806 Transcript_116180/m.339806 type:complete len:322 (+) Transcript_116180:1455-2420(+)